MALGRRTWDGAALNTNFGCNAYLRRIVYSFFQYSDVGGYNNNSEMNCSSRKKYSSGRGGPLLSQLEFILAPQCQCTAARWWPMGLLLEVDIHT